MSILMERIEKNKMFFEKREVKTPLLGCYIGGWEDLSRYQSDTQSLLKKGFITAPDIKVAKFSPVYDGYTQKLLYEGDDFVRCLEPLPSLPWTEGALGCLVEFTGKNFWSKKIGLQKLLELMDEGYEKLSNDYVLKYLEFIKYLSERGEIPVGQAIMRGPLDMIFGAIGEEELILMFYDDPDLAKKLIDFAADLYLAFSKKIVEATPLFCGGGVMGQYYLWLPKKCQRIQEDGVALITPAQYEEFVLPADEKISQAAPICLYHTHYTSHFLMDIICKNKNVDIVQITKDEGVPMEHMIEGMERVQKNGKAMLMKGFVNEADIRLIAKKIDKQGFALGMVTQTKAEADELIKYARNFGW